MKYRIVEINNGKYQVQCRSNWLDTWTYLIGDLNTVEECEFYVKDFTSREIKKIVKVIE